MSRQQTQPLSELTLECRQLVMAYERMRPGAEGQIDIRGMDEFQLRLVSGALRTLLSRGGAEAML